MKRIIALALTITAGTIAMASDNEGTLDAVKTEAIKSQLTAEGYEVRKVEIEDGMYEAYAMKDGKKYEVYLDADLNVIKAEEDD